MKRRRIHCDLILSIDLAYVKKFLSVKLLRDALRRLSILLIELDLARSPCQAFQAFRHHLLMAVRK